MEFHRLDLWHRSVFVHPLEGETQRAESLNTWVVIRPSTSDWKSGLTETGKPTYPVSQSVTPCPDYTINRLIDYMIMKKSRLIDYYNPAVSKWCTAPS